MIPVHEILIALAALLGLSALAVAVALVVFYVRSAHQPEEGR